jgi:hypothetical protein
MDNKTKKPKRIKNENSYSFNCRIDSKLFEEMNTIRLRLNITWAELLERMHRQFVERDAK